MKVPSSFSPHSWNDGMGTWKSSGGMCAWFSNSANNGCTFILNNKLKLNKSLMWTLDFMQFQTLWWAFKLISLWLQQLEGRWSQVKTQATCCKWHYYKREFSGFLGTESRTVHMSCPRNATVLWPCLAGVLRGPREKPNPPGEVLVTVTAGCLQVGSYQTQR